MNLNKINSTSSICIFRTLKIMKFLNPLLIKRGLGFYRLFSIIKRRQLTVSLLTWNGELILSHARQLHKLFRLWKWVLSTFLDVIETSGLSLYAVHPLSLISLKYSKTLKTQRMVFWTAFYSYWIMCERTCLFRDRSRTGPSSLIWISVPFKNFPEDC